MERKQLRRRLVCCLLATLSVPFAQMDIVSAGDGFIRQPGMSKTTPAATASELAPASQTGTAQQDSTAQPVSKDADAKIALSTNARIQAPSLNPTHSPASVQARVASTQIKSSRNAPSQSVPTDGAGTTARPQTTNRTASAPAAGGSKSTGPASASPGDGFRPRESDTHSSTLDSDHNATGTSLSPYNATPPVNRRVQIQIRPSSASEPKIITAKPTTAAQSTATVATSESVDAAAPSDDWTGISLSSPMVADTRSESDLVSPGADSLQWVTRGENEPSNPSSFASPTFAASNLQSDKDGGFYSSIPMVQKPSSAGGPASGTSEPTASPEQLAAFQKQQAKQDLASMVSHKILQSRPKVSQEDVAKKTVGPVESLPGWQSIAEELQQRMMTSRDLMRRRAFLSARQEAEGGIVSLVQFLDGIGNRYHCEPAWAAALRALQECEDFYAEQRTSTDSRMLQRLIESHETPVLKDADARQLAPMTAAQHYRLYAQACIEVATQNHPLASDVLYAMGRTYQAQAEYGEGREDVLRWRAVTLYRAATKANPNNALAANELGYLLLQMDRPRDAQAALIASVNTQVSAHALQNLIEASRRLRDQGTMNWASSTLASLNQAPSSATPAVVEVTPQAFAALSPLAAGPQPTGRPASFQNP